MSDRPTVSIDPMVQGGAPCLAGTRITVSCLVGCLVADIGASCEKVAGWYEITPEDVRVCCWYAARYGDRNLDGRTPEKKMLRRKWDQWSDSNWRHTDPPKVDS